MTIYREHAPQGDPCKRCGKPPSAHRVDVRVYHYTCGDPCTRCGEAASAHRYVRDTRENHIPDGDPCKVCGQPADKHKSRQIRQKKEQRFAGIDGEGQGRLDHRYILLAASDEEGKEWYVEDPNGLDTVTCLEFILSIPNDRKLFAYGFQYDLTKILADLNNERLWHLMRPEERKFTIEKGIPPIRWKDYLINLQSTKFTLQKGKRKKVVWDLLKFYQCKFVSALKTWQVGDPALWEQMSAMKAKRSEFDKETLDNIRPYCLSECKALSHLARKLVDAHTDADLKLYSFYGAGSTSSAILEKMEIKSRLNPPPDEIFPAIASSFFGGRFEQSVIGEIKSEVYGYDISSAYPYQLYFLPCQLHGYWEKTTSKADLERARTAIVKYKLHHTKGASKSWGPFPFRTPEGSICYPGSSDGGWIWKDEYLAGEKIFPGVEFKYAWAYHCECDCQPFKLIPFYYTERIRIGKNGAGIIYKLGPNGVYGKLAQSVGDPPYNSWWWAGMVTSGCRAQMLEMMGLHQDLRNLLMIATDGLYTREKLTPPAPRDTGTLQTGIPLGGWEHKPEDVFKDGMFFARPGIYFPLNPTKEQLKKVRARGLGRSVVIDNRQKIIDSWHKYGDTKKVHLDNVTRFCGMKSSISRSVLNGKYLYKRALSSDGVLPSYGSWITRPVEMDFNPQPKRERIRKDCTLELRHIPRHMNSTPYNKALISEERRRFIELAIERMEQPDFDFVEY